MSDPCEFVAAFCAEWSKSHSAMLNAFRAAFTQDTVWENVGSSTTRGVEEALALLVGMRDALGAETIAVDMLAIVADGNRVLTERVDRLLAADGSERGALRLMGIFEIADDRIVAWRDYFDTAALKPA